MRALSLAADGEPDAERAFFVADLSQVYLQWQRWKRCLPEIEPFFGTSPSSFESLRSSLTSPFLSYKIQPRPLRPTFARLSWHRFRLCVQRRDHQCAGLGCFPLSNHLRKPVQSNSFIRHAAKTNVEMMTFDNSDELYKIARSFPTAKLIIRIHTDDTKALCRLNLKFGASLVAVPSLLAKAKELGLNVIGVSFHVGSGCFDSSAFR
jgi:ornithine decarboxylase